MPLLHKIKTLANLPFDTMGLFVKAVFISAIVRFTLLFLSFRKVLRWLGTAQKETSQHLNEAQQQYAQKVKSALWLCNKYTPWKTECYVQALTARILLRQRNVPSTIYIGFLRTAEQMKGHAWLRSGNLIVTGNKGHTTFQVHSFFS